MITSIGTVASSKSADDYVLIGDKLKPKDGQYILKITEELWETAYFDQVKLITVDHPASNQISKSAITELQVGGRRQWAKPLGKKSSKSMSSSRNVILACRSACKVGIRHEWIQP